MKYLATVGITTVILVAVLLPGSNVPAVGIVGIDKAVHFLLFFTWIIAVRYDFNASFKWTIALAVGILFSVLTEVLQIAIDGRTFDWADILFDSLGAIAGVAAGPLCLAWLSRLKRRFMR